MKVPKDYIVEKDKSPERKANLSQLDVKFARAITRIQREIEIALNILVRRHLALRKFTSSVIDSVEISLCPPSDMFEKRRLELDEQKVRVVQALKGLQLFPNEWILENYYQMSDDEISSLTDKMKEQMKDDAELQQSMQPDMGMGGAVPPPPIEGEELPPEEEV